MDETVLLCDLMNGHYLLIVRMLMALIVFCCFPIISQAPLVILVTNQHLRLLLLVNLLLGSFHETPACRTGMAVTLWVDQLSSAVVVLTAHGGVDVGPYGGADSRTVTFLPVRGQVRHLVVGGTGLYSGSAGNDTGKERGGVRVLVAHLVRCGVDVGAKLLMQCVLVDFHRAEEFVSTGWLLLGELRCDLLLALWLVEVVGALGCVHLLVLRAVQRWPHFVVRESSLWVRAIRFCFLGAILIAIIQILEAKYLHIRLRSQVLVTRAAFDQVLQVVVQLQVGLRVRRVHELLTAVFMCVRGRAEELVAHLVEVEWVFGIPLLLLSLLLLLTCTLQCRTMT